MTNNIRTADSVSRRKLSSCYIDNMITYLSTSKKISRDAARRFVKKVIDDRLKTPNIEVVETRKPGEVDVKTIPFSKLVSWSTRNVMSPSGSIYKPANRATSVVVDLVGSGLIKRGMKKKDKFKFLASGDFEKAAKADGEQNTLKVKLNSLPGNLGSPFSLFYDKGGYNSVTSTARMLISNSFTCCEQLLGGNTPLFDESEAINLCVLAIRLGPSDAKIMDTVNRYGIRVVEREELLMYFTEQIRMHSSAYKASDSLIDMINNIGLGTVQFLYYHSNLKHLIQGNEDIFKPMISNLFNYSHLKEEIDSSISVDKWNKIDSDSKAVITTLLSEEIGAIQPMDIPEKKPNIARLGIMLYKRFQSFNRKLSDLMDVFIYHNINFQSVLTRKNMQRKVVVVSDTDSVIFTAEQWCAWYTGHTNRITYGSYCMSALVTYWLTKANADTMAKFIIGIGAIGKAIPTIAMKNEFLYPSLMLFDIKKMYAGLIAVQEGVVMQTPEPDIKGGIIRGASASMEAREFNKTLLVEKVLKPISRGPLDVWTLIDPIIQFEDRIIRSLKEGKLEFHPVASVDTKSSYKTPMSSPYAYLHAWNSIFGEKYGEAIPPDKLPLVKLIKKPTEMYWEWLKKKSPDIYHKFIAYNEKFCKNNIPSAFYLSDTMTSIPEELVPLIDIRGIVLNNLTPAYHILASLNVPVGYRKRFVILRDLYGGPVDEV